MARIIIGDLPPDSTLNREDLRKVCGGTMVNISSGNTLAAFPDICTTPSPGGPIPIPYPNIGMSSNTSQGSKKVKFDGNPVMIKGASYSLSGGDEAGTE